MITHTSPRLLFILLATLLAAPWVSFGQDTNGLDPRVDRMLKQMGTYLAEAQTLSFHADVTTDEVLTSGQMLQYGRSVDVLMRRPDGIRASSVGDQVHKRFWYDGQHITLLDTQENLYATAEAPAELDAALDFAMEQFGVSVPLADFVFNDPYATLTERVRSGFYVGLHTVDGVQTHHLALTQEEIDWQIWVDDGPQFVPRKLVITYKDLPGSPQFTALFSEWKIDLRLPDALFTFEPPQGAEAIDFLPAYAAQ